jgi:flagellar secretion chaperone FliS
MYARAAARYRDVDLESAPKTQIVERLFARFERDLDDARAAITAKNIIAKAKSIDHATQIVIQLRAALDHKAAPDLCANLDSLYRYVLEQLSTANAKLDPKPLAAANAVMKTLGDAFRQAHRK